MSHHFVTIQISLTKSCNITKQCYQKEITQKSCVISTLFKQEKKYCAHSVKVNQKLNPISDW